MWETFVCTTLGLEVPVLTTLPRRNQHAPALCCCKKHCIDTYIDHTATCTAHSSATKSHDWAVGVLGPLFRSAGHTVRTQYQVTASPGHLRIDVEIREYVRDAAGNQSLVFDLSITHDRFGSSTHVQQNGALSHPQDLDTPLRLAEQRKINSYRQHYADNQNISLLPAIMTTSSRMHGEFLCFPFLQAHRETTAHFIATGLPSQQTRSDKAFRFKCDAFYMVLKTKVGLVSAKASALRINLNIQDCSVVAPSLHNPSCAPLLLPLLLSHNIPLPDVH